MPESFQSTLLRLGFNFFPCYMGSAGKVTYIASDYKEAHIELPMNWKTRNYVGTIFGGSMFGATDPMFMLMLIKCLGKDYVVWDKAGSIKFIKPGRSTLYAKFFVTDEDLEDIRTRLLTEPKMERTFRTELCDRDGVVHAVVERLIHVRLASTVRA